MNDLIASDTDARIAVQRKIARKNYGLWIFVISTLIGAALAYWGGDAARSRGFETGIAATFAIVCEAMFFAVAAYRVTIGKGWLIGSLALVLAVAEFIMKMIDSTSNMTFAAIMAIALYRAVVAVIACWRIKALHERQVSTMTTT